MQNPYATRNTPADLPGGLRSAPFVDRFGRAIAYGLVGYTIPHAIVHTLCCFRWNLWPIGDNPTGHGALLVDSYWPMTGWNLALLLPNVMSAALFFRTGWARSSRGIARQAKYYWHTVSLSFLASYGVMMYAAFFCEAFSQLKTGVQRAFCELATSLVLPLILAIRYRKQ